MTTRLPLFGGRDVSFESARYMEEDVSKRIRQHYQTVAAKEQLAQHSERGLISGLVAHHFGINGWFTKKRCVGEPVDNWLRGSFNLCVPVRVGDADGHSSQRVLLRCPMAHKLSGMVEEKMICEVATYIWMQENCPEMPIPRLLLHLAFLAALM